MTMKLNAFINQWKIVKKSLMTTQFVQLRTIEQFCGLAKT